MKTVINLLKLNKASALMRFVFLWFITLIIFGCSPTKKIGKNKYLINNYKVSFENKNIYKNITKSEVEEILYPYTNRKIFGFYRFYLQMYYLGDTKNLKKNINQKKQELYQTNIKKKEKYELKKAKYEKKIANKTKKKSYKKFKPKTYKPTFNQWLTEVVGESPVLLDSLAVQKNNKKITNLLFTKGYFNSTTNYSIDTFNKIFFSFY